MTAAPSGGLGGHQHFKELVRQCNPGKSLAQVCEGKVKPDGKPLTPDFLRYWMRPERAKTMPTPEQCEQLAEYVNSNWQAVWFALAADVGVKYEPGLSRQEWALVSAFRSLSCERDRTMAQQILVTLCRLPHLQVAED